MDEKLNTLQDSVDEVILVQVEQKYILAEHMRRTAANEGRLDVMESFHGDFKDHMAQLSGAIKLFKFMVAAGSITLLAIELYNYFN